jgi:hypothetical protein
VGQGREVGAGFADGVVEAWYIQVNAIFLLEIGSMPISPRRRKSKFLERHGSTIVALVISILLAAICYLLYLTISPAHPRLRELSFHASLAFTIAFLLTIFVEYNLGRRHQEEVAIDVWSAVLRTLAPEAIVDELKYILKGEVTKERLRYTLTFEKPYPGMDANQFVLRRELTFTLTNVTNRKVAFPLETTIDARHGYVHLNKNGEEITLPRHIKLNLDGVEVPLIEGRTLFTEDRQCRVEKTLKIRRGGSTKVYLCGEEALELSAGGNSYIQVQPSVGLEVIVKNHYEDRLEIRELLLNHPNWAEFGQTEEQIYKFDGGILPGQGFQVSWSAK